MSRTRPAMPALTVLVWSRTATDTFVTGADAAAVLAALVAGTGAAQTGSVPARALPGLRVDAVPVGRLLRSATPVPTAGHVTVGVPRTSRADAVQVGLLACRASWRGTPVTCLGLGGFHA